MNIRVAVLFCVFAPLAAVGAQTRIVLKGEKGDPGAALDPQKAAALTARYVAKSGDALAGPLVPANTARTIWVPGSRFTPIGNAGSLDTVRWLAGPFWISGPGFGFSYPGTNKSTADMIALLHLPDGATIEAVSCAVVDDDATAGHDLRLSLYSLAANGALATCGTADTSALSLNDSESISLPTGGCTGLVVSNDFAALNVFGILAEAATPSTSAEMIALWGCGVSFSVSAAAP